MSDRDTDFDEGAHSKLLESINSLGKRTKKKPLIRKRSKKICAQELVELIQSTRNVDDVKKKLVKKRRRRRRRRTVVEGGPQTLQAPTHRLARERIESSIAYKNIRRDLEVWAPVVKKSRLAEQVVFPLDKDASKERTASERLIFFKPRTPLEIEMAELLATSKNNLRDGEKYTEAELELLRAMSLKEAKAKWAQLQKTRALVGYREAKLKRQAKIKSKSYHRHLKRQKRKKLIKEFEELMVKDPDAAREKLEEIDRQRILERATLKHRNGGKNIQQLARYASKNKEFKKVYEQQISLGRELTKKHGREEDSDGEGREGIDTAKLSSAEMLQRAAELLEKEENETQSTKPRLRAKLHEMRQQKQEVLRSSAAEAKSAVVTSLSVGSPNLDTETPASTKHNEKPVGNVRQVKETLCDAEQFDDKQCKQNFSLLSVGQMPHNKTNEGKSKKNRKQLKKGVKKVEKKKECSNEGEVDIDQLFDKAEDELTEAAIKECERLKVREEQSLPDQNHYIFTAESAKNSERKEGKESIAEVEKTPLGICVDPRHFLQVETSTLAQVSADFVESLENFNGETKSQEAITDAFEDVDVIGDFTAEKEAAEEAENPKDIDLRLQGWGSWTGPGIINKDSNRFLIRMPKKRRKDAGRTGVIIAEAMDKSIEKIQLRSVPFPYTTVEDYEAVVRQPLGKEWNPQQIHRKLVKPQIVTKAGRIIKPLTRSVLQSMEEKNSDSELL